MSSINIKMLLCVITLFVATFAADFIGKVTYYQSRGTYSADGSFIFKLQSDGGTTHIYQIPQVEQCKKEMISGLLNAMNNGLYVKVNTDSDWSWIGSFQVSPSPSF